MTKYWLGKKRPDMSGKNNPMSNPEIALKVSKARIGIKFSEEHKLKLSLAKLGKYKGDKHPNWKGGKSKSGKRILVRRENHSKKHHGNYVYESRAVMEEHLGRELTSEEVVHHINLDPSDNRLENLILFANQAEHTKHHWDLKRPKI